MSTNQGFAYATPTVLPQVELSSSWATSAVIVASDFITLSAVYWLAVIGRYLFNSNFDLRFYLGLYPVITLFLGAFYIQNLYPGTMLHPVEEIRSISKCITIVFLLIALGTFLGHNSDVYSRSIFLIMWACGAPGILLARHFVRRNLSTRSWWGTPAIILGSGPCADRIIEGITKRHTGLHVAGILADNRPVGREEGCPPVLGGLSMGPLLAKRRIAEYAIIAMPDKTAAELRHIIQTFCRGFQHVLVVPDLPGICSLGTNARELGGEVGIELPQRLSHRSAGLAKRVFDVLSSTVLLLLLAPLFVVVAVAIKLTSTGPVFFGHTRHGRDGQTFKALKFRTMAKNASELLAAYLQSHPELQAEWHRDQKLKTDPRVTLVGKWLRRYSLDELPQLLNVLCGNMSLVGPRPIVKNEIDKYGDGYDLYTRVPPGITGLWQVSGRNNTTYAERVAFDEYYVRNWSIWLDAYILIRTVKAVFAADGAY